MDLNRLTRDADDLLRKVVSRYNQLYVPSGSVSQLELDLMLDDLRKLYDTFKTIGQLQLALQQNPPRPEVLVNKQIPAEPEFKPEPAATADNAATVYTSPDIEHKPEHHAVNVPHTESEKVHQLYTEPEQNVNSGHDVPGALIEEVTESNPEPLPVEPEFHYEETKPIVNPEVTPEASEPERGSAMLADKFNTPGRSLSETIASAQPQNGMGSRILIQPIADLATGIGLNDKFSFISELFANQIANYDEAISRMNKAVNSDEANWILQKYHTAEWENKAETVARLKDFVKRRFI